MSMFKKVAKQFLQKDLLPSLAEESDSTFSPTAHALPSFNKEAFGKQNFDDEEIVSSLPDLIEEPETIIGENVCIKGSVSFKRLLRIDGTFEGELLSEGRLIIGPKGSVTANIDMEEAFISGKIKGDIHVKQRLVLRGKAEIRGNIVAATLSVDEGVTIIGHVHIEHHAASQEAQTASP